MQMPCPQCRKPVAIPEGMPGQQVICQSCLTQFQVPNAGMQGGQQLPPDQQNPAFPPTAQPQPNPQTPLAGGQPPQGQYVSQQPSSPLPTSVPPTAPQIEGMPGTVPVGPPSSRPDWMVERREGIDLQQTLGQGFQCPHCSTTQPPRVEEKTSAAGWVLFVALLFVCLPLCWLGILVKESYKVCNGCGSKLGESW